MQFHLSRTACVFHKLGKRQKDKRIILETISISHYVEKVFHLKIILEVTKSNLCWQSQIQVRWAMDYMNIPYEEEENSGILGIMALGRSVPQLKVNNMSDYFRATFQIPQADLTITNSADILRYLYGCHAGRSSTK